MKEVLELEKRFGVRLRINERGNVGVSPKKRGEKPEVVAAVKALGPGLRQLLLERQERQERSKASPDETNGDDSLDAETGAPAHPLDLELAAIAELRRGEAGPALRRFLARCGIAQGVGADGQPWAGPGVCRALESVLQRFAVDLCLAAPGGMLSPVSGTSRIVGRVLDSWPAPLSDAESRASVRLNLKQGTTVGDALAVLTSQHLPYLCWQPQQIRSARAKLEAQNLLDQTALGAGASPSFMYVRTMSGVIEIPRLDS